MRTFEQLDTRANARLALFLPSFSGNASTPQDKKKQRLQTDRDGQRQTDRQNRAGMYQFVPFTVSMAVVTAFRA